MHMVKEEEMKKAIFSRAVISIMAVAGIILMPTLALSTVLTPISHYSVESTAQSGPPDTIDRIANFFGYYPNLIGPGGPLTGVTFYGTHTSAVASASSWLNVAWYQFWDYGSTQKATDSFWWAAIYQLNGNPGSTANISLDYTYKNSRSNLVFDGRSESKSGAVFFDDIVPASATGNYSQSAGDALQTFFSFPLPWLPPPTSPAFWDYTAMGSVGYDQNYHFAALTWADDTATGSFPVGSMEVGDQLYLVGGFAAESQAQAYAMSVEIATMVSLLDTSLLVSENPPSTVPEPATMLLLGFGIVGLCGARRFKK
jgi:PEP-CTERM motif